VNPVTSPEAAAAPPAAALGSAVFEAVLAGADDAIFIAAVSGSDLASARVVFVNDAFVAVTGHTADVALGAGPADLLSLSTSRALGVQGSSRSAPEQLLRRPDGTPYWAEVAVRPILVDGAIPTLPDGTGLVVGTVRDVDERHHAAERLAHAASHDSLTNLPNRSMLLEHLEAALAARAASSGEVAVLFVDLDNFKLVNDSLGHDHGDEVLRQVAARLDAITPGGDLVGRFGGDEMVVVHTGADSASAGDLADRFLSALAEPMVIAGRERVMTASIGVALSGSDAGVADQLLRHADTALYAAKARGRARYEVFSDDLFERIAHRVQIEAELRVALREAQLYVEYQPQVDLETGRLVGVEALARWWSPERGLVPPIDFIPVAEDCGLITELGAQVMSMACRQFVAWQRELRSPPPSMTVNVSVLQLAQDGYVDQLAAELAASGIDPAALTLEITESALVDSGTDVVDVLRRLRELGVYLAIDDFGTEYSSLARLRDLPVEVLKIDRSFVDGLGTEPGDTAIVSSIMSLAIAMGLHVIAEGVETEAQARALAGLGCGVAQGYLFSRPVAALDIADLAGRRLWRPPFEPTARSLAALPLTGRQPMRRGRRFFVDEFLDHIGVPMSDDGDPDDVPAGPPADGGGGAA